MGHLLIEGDEAGQAFLEPMVAGPDPTNIKKMSNRQETMQARQEASQNKDKSWWSTLGITNTPDKTRLRTGKEGTEVDLFLMW